MTKPKVPSYRGQKKPNGEHLAFVVLNGQRVYLGAWNTAESREHYQQTVAEGWLAGDRPWRNPWSMLPSRLVTSPATGTWMTSICRPWQRQLAIGYNWNPACDLNSNGYVDDLDSQIFMAAYGTSSGQTNYNPACDFTGDGNINGSDVTILEAATDAYVGDPNYNPACDFNNDGWVDVVDLLTLADYYGL